MNKPIEVGKKHNPNTGHRERLRQRFLKHGLVSFQDYEVLELLLLYVSRQKDMKPVAKKLIEKFGSFNSVLDVPYNELKVIDGIGDASTTLIHFIKQASTRYLDQKSRLSTTPQDLSDIIGAYRLKLGTLTYEQFELICLNSNFVIVSEDIIAEGTIDQATVYPRKVIELAIKHGATTLIFVHNHPSGDLTPSEMDKLITKNLILAARTVGVNVYDHLIVSSKGYSSFREQSLL
jgi:DNA repair protein RadC